jgi:hypothetical protein
LAGVQIEGAIKADLVPLRIRAHYWRMATRRPNRLSSRLEVEGSLIFGQIDRIGSLLGLIDYFFSTCSSKSAILACERDLKTLAGR